MALDGLPQDLNAKGTRQERGNSNPPTSVHAAILIVLIACIIFYNFRSTSLIGDGLRYLPVLRTILPGASPTFQPRPWLEVYRNHYVGLVVHNHFCSAPRCGQLLHSNASSALAEMQSLRCKQ